MINFVLWLDDTVFTIVYFLFSLLNKTQDKPLPISYALNLPVIVFENSLFIISNEFFWEFAEIEIKKNSIVKYSFTFDFYACPPSFLASCFPSP